MLDERFLPQLFDELVKNRRERVTRERRGGKKTAIGTNGNANDKLTSANAMQVHCTRGFKIKVNDQINQIRLIDNIRNMVGIKLYFITLNNRE